MTPIYTFQLNLNTAGISNDELEQLEQGLVEYIQNSLPFTYSTKFIKRELSIKHDRETVIYDADTV